MPATYSLQQRLLKVLNYLEIDFMLPEFTAGVRIIKASCELPNTSVEFLLEIRNNNPVQIDIVIGLPENFISGLPDERSRQVANLLNYTTLMNSFRNHHPGFWVTNADSGKTSYCYQMKFFPNGDGFETMFRHALISTISTFDECYPGIYALLKDSSTPTNAVNQFIFRHVDLID